MLSELTGQAWNLEDYVAFASGSDVDLMTHVIEAVASSGDVCLFPGDWFGFRVGSTHQDNLHWRLDATDSLACLCIPSVRNGHVTDEMTEFLESASSCLLNLNLYPTLSSEERFSVARQLLPFLSKSLLSISFSRGFGMTASQLGVMLVHRDHPLRHQYEVQWNWFTYFFNAIATKAIEELDLAELQKTDELRRDWVSQWLKQRGLPNVSSGSYYVKSFQLAKPQSEEIPEWLQPLHRDGVIRMCFKPPIFSSNDPTLSHHP